MYDGNVRQSAEIIPSARNGREGGKVAGMKERLLLEFRKIFGGGGDILTCFSPGRVNLIGEHTDYNGGHVLPCALTIGTYAAARKRQDRTLRFYSMNFENVGIIECPIHGLVYRKEDNWANYPKGILWTMERLGLSVNNGMDILYFGNIPNGSGLSSSASIEILTAYLVKHLFGFHLDAIQLARIGQSSERQFNGVNCGIMDQFAISMGKAGQAIFLDTSSLEYEYVPVELDDAKLVIGNTNKRRGLGESRYNERRQECETALSELQTVFPVQSLGELTEEQFEAGRHVIKDPVMVKRARHAVYENRRTMKAAKALKEHKLKQFGQMMKESHISLRDDYEVTGVELDTLVDAAMEQEGVIGARMTGAGFGGCTVNLVGTDYIDRFIERAGRTYRDKIGYVADFYVVEVGDGPSVI